MLVILNRCPAGHNTGGSRPTLPRYGQQNMPPRCEARKNLGMFGRMGSGQETEEHMKGMVAPGTMFEELGWHYIALDGHDLPQLVSTLNVMAEPRTSPCISVL